MADDPLAKYTQPETFLDGPLFMFEGESIPVPPGTTAPRSPWQQFRVVVPGNEPRAAEVVLALIERIQQTVNDLANDPAKLEDLRRAAETLAKPT